jgi:hypothetical protein
MDETYRMLGRDHEADLEREAEKWRLAAEARGQRRASGREPDTREERKLRSFVGARLTVFRARRVASDG